MKSPMDYLAGTHEAIEQYLDDLEAIEANLKAALNDVAKMKIGCRLIEIEIRHMFEKDNENDSTGT